MSPMELDRREFIVRAAAAAAAAAACMPAALGASPSVGGGAPGSAFGDWHVDDMWGVYPRPHEAIGYGRPLGDDELRGAMEPQDPQLPVG
jgi:hypothetical protein